MNGFTAAISLGRAPAQALPSTAFSETEAVSSNKVTGVAGILQESRKTRQEQAPKVDGGLRGSEAAEAWG